MITIHNVQLKHNGLLADNSTKLTLYLPECTDQQHMEVIRMAKTKIVGVILVEPDMLENISDLLRQAEEVNNTLIDSEQPPIDGTGNPPIEYPPVTSEGTGIGASDDIKAFAGEDPFADDDFDDDELDY